MTDVVGRELNALHVPEFSSKCQKILLWILSPTPLPPSRVLLFSLPASPFRPCRRVSFRFLFLLPAFPNLQNVLPCSSLCLNVPQCFYFRSYILSFHQNERKREKEWRKGEARLFELLIVRRSLTFRDGEKSKRLSRILKLSL